VRAHLERKQLYQKGEGVSTPFLIIFVFFKNE